MVETNKSIELLAQLGWLQYMYQLVKTTDVKFNPMTSLEQRQVLDQLLKQGIDQGAFSDKKKAIYNDKNITQKEKLSLAYNWLNISSKQAGSNFRFNIMLQKIKGSNFTANNLMPFNILGSKKSKLQVYTEQEFKDLIRPILLNLQANPLNHFEQLMSKVKEPYVRKVKTGYNTAVTSQIDSDDYSEDLDEVVDLTPVQIQEETKQESLSKKSSEKQSVQRLLMPYTQQAIYNKKQTDNYAKQQLEIQQINADVGQYQQVSEEEKEIMSDLVNTSIEIQSPFYAGIIQDAKSIKDPLLKKIFIQNAALEQLQALSLKKNNQNSVAAFKLIADHQGVKYLEKARLANLERQKTEGAVALVQHVFDPVSNNAQSQGQSVNNIAILPIQQTTQVDPDARANISSQQIVEMSRPEVVQAEEVKQFTDPGIIDTVNYLAAKHRVEESKQQLNEPTFEQQQERLQAEFKEKERQLQLNAQQYEDRKKAELGSAYDNQQNLVHYQESHERLNAEYGKLYETLRQKYGLSASYIPDAKKSPGSNIDSQIAAIDFDPEFTQQSSNVSEADNIRYQLRGFIYGRERAQSVDLQLAQRLAFEENGLNVSFIGQNISGIRELQRLRQSLKPARQQIAGNANNQQLFTISIPRPNMAPEVLVVTKANYQKYLSIILPICQNIQGNITGGSLASYKNKTTIYTEKVKKKETVKFEIAPGTAYKLRECC